MPFLCQQRSKRLEHLIKRPQVVKLIVPKDHCEANKFVSTMFKTPQTFESISSSKL